MAAATAVRPTAKPVRPTEAGARAQAGESRGLGTPTPDGATAAALHRQPLKQIHVHHTATGNDYARADVPGILRGMYRYHTQTLGWFDIGYNFLVDRFGRAWVGRSGGANRLVRGAHTLGFNERSVGIAVIGNLEERRPSAKALRTVIRLAAWKLDRYGREATGRVSRPVHGQRQVRRGRARAAPGHRRAPRHQRHRLPGGVPLREAAGDPSTHPVADQPLLTGAL